jgi:RimJ/RimL family protein N-acetyltransferase
VLRRLLRRLRPTRVDEWLYEMTAEDALALDNPDLEVQHRAVDGPTGRKETYIVTLDGQTAHRSWLFWSVRLTRQCGFDARAPVIGDCHTEERFRGRAIYPKVLRYIARDVAERGAAAVYVLVSPANLPSVRGIEKAGFRRRARLRGTRLAGLMFGCKVEHCS